MQVSASERQFLESRDRRDDQYDKNLHELCDYFQANKMSKSNSLMYEKEVIGPTFSSLQFKMDIDQMNSRLIGDELCGQESHGKWGRRCSQRDQREVDENLIDIPMKSENDFELDHSTERRDILLQEIKNRSSDQLNLNYRSVSIQSSDKNTFQQAFVQQKESINDSLDWRESHLQNISGFNLNFQKYSKNVVRNGESGDVSLKTLKQQRSALMRSQEGSLPLQNVVDDLSKHSIVSACQHHSAQLLKIQCKSSLSPTKLALHDIVLKNGMTSEVDCSSINKRSQIRHSMYDQSGLYSSTPLHLLNSKAGNEHVSSDLMQIDKSAGDLSQKIIGFQGVWVESAFQILTLVKKFISILKECSMKQKFSQMKRTYFDLIDDKANDYSFYEINQYFTHTRLTFLQKQVYCFQGFFNRNCIYINQGDYNKVKQWLSYLFQFKINIIHPNSLFKIIWNCFILLLLCSNLLYIPIKISFSEESSFNRRLLFFLDDLPSWAFIGDIMINFHTGYYSKGVIENDRFKIFKHYIRGSFWWDLLIIMPFIFQSILNYNLLNIILLCRSSKISNIVCQIEELVNLKPFYTAVMNLIKLVLFIIYIAHICGCFFFYMHVIIVEQDASTETWVVKNNLIGKGWIAQYVASVYWAVITMITVGYGDIYPITTIEKVYVAAVTLLSCGVFAYAVNAIGYIIQDMTKRSTQFKIKMSSLTSHMRIRDLS